MHFAFRTALRHSEEQTTLEITIETPKARKIKLKINRKKMEMKLRRKEDKEFIKLEKDSK